MSPIPPRCPTTGKVSFTSKRDAVSRANFLTRDRHRRRTTHHLRSYQCEYCHLWHLTSRQDLDPPEKRKPRHKPRPQQEDDDLWRYY